MQILFVSTATSSQIIENIFEYSGRNPGFSIQKYYSLLIKGFIKNGTTVSVLSRPVVHYKEKHFLPKNNRETVDGINYKYIPIIKSKTLYRLFQISYSFIYTLTWGFRNRKHKFVYCDTLKVSTCIGCLLASKILGLKSIGMVTDMPGMTGIGTGKQTNNLLLSKLHFLVLPFFTGFVLITKYLNPVINKYNHPFIVMEGIVDYNFNFYIQQKKNHTFDILYAGGLAKEYGLELLIKAFMKLRKNDVRLIIFGNGPYSDDIRKMALIDNRIIFKGVALNSDVVKAEHEASLLVNPRPTDAAFTKYSFPGKNLEYMISATPLLTTRLLGMPSEYYQYVYLFNEETVDGYYTVLNKIVNYDMEELTNKGFKAKQFILKEKNNLVQTRRILDFAKSL